MSIFNLGALESGAHGVPAAKSGWNILETLDDQTL
jgi:hypothetical protein